VLKFFGEKLGVGLNARDPGKVTQVILHGVVCTVTLVILHGVAAPEGGCSCQGGARLSPPSHPLEWTSPLCRAPATLDTNSSEFSCSYRGKKISCSFFLERLGVGSNAGRIYFLRGRGPFSWGYSPVCKVTAVILHGVTSPVILHGVVSPDFSPVTCAHSEWF